MDRKIISDILRFLFLAVLLACPCCKKKEDIIKIGFFGPLTGPTAQAGQALKNGAQIAIDQINAQGGLLGKQLKLVEYDDKSSPEQAVKAVTKMVQLDRVTAIIGSLHSGNILAAAPQIEQFTTPMIGAGTSPSWLEQGYKYLFRSVGNSGLSVKELARYSAKARFKQVSVLHSNDEYGIVGAKLFIEQAQENGLEIIAQESFTHGDRDFTGQFARILAEEPEAVFIWALGDDLGALTKQLRQTGFNGPILGAEGYTLPQVLEIAGESANNVIFVAQYLVPDSLDDVQDPLMRSFLEQYYNKYSQMPVSDNAYRGYDAVNIMAEAIRKTASLDRTKIRDGIANIENFKGLAGDFTFKGRNGEGIDHMRVYKIIGGKYIEIK
ncbi:MAG: ABC transporter substrate-binding protein [Planctomycetota bacterium]